MAVDAVMTALDDQVKCYQQLAKLAELQHEHVQQNRTEQLLEVLRRRQEVLEGLTRLEAVIGPAKKRWGDYLSELEPPRRARAEELLAQTRQLLEEIVTADRHDALVLQQRKLNVGRQINQARTARRVNRNYAAVAYGPTQSRMDVGG